jgi:hypothetical protein
VLRTCTGPDIDAALADGEVIEVEWGDARAIALVDLAESEEMLADGLAALAAENRLAVVVGQLAAGRTQALATALGGVPAVVLDDAHRLGIDDVLAAVEDLPEDSVLALSLDPALPLAPVPGAVALDLAASGVCPVLRATAPPARTTLARARVDVAAGQWFGTSAEDRSLVEVRVSGPDEALVRVAQLVGTSIPRAFDVPASEVAVLLAPGSLEPSAVSDAAPGTTVVPLLGPIDRAWDAAVLVLGPPGPGFTRAVVYAGLVAGDRHVSVVHGAEPAALAAAMAGAPDRPRRTRLAALLAG